MTMPQAACHDDAFDAPRGDSYDAPEPGEALGRARRAAALGYRSGVLRSHDFRNLELGLWVTFAGVYEGPERAERAVARLHSRGVARAPYVRLVDGS